MTWMQWMLRKPSFHPSVSLISGMVLRFVADLALLFRACYCARYASAGSVLHLVNKVKHFAVPEFSEVTLGYQAN